MPYPSLDPERHKHRSTEKSQRNNERTREREWRAKRPNEPEDSEDSKNGCVLENAHTGAIDSKHNLGSAVMSSRICVTCDSFALNCNQDRVNTPRLNDHQCLQDYMLHKGQLAKPLQQHLCQSKVQREMRRRQTTNLLSISCRCQKSYGQHAIDAIELKSSCASGPGSG